jgi:hypothetical protein
MGPYFIGIDLGQCIDYTTIAVVERAELKGEWNAAQYAWQKVIELRVRKLERIPLGTPYPDIADRIVAMTHKGPLANQCHLIVDGTGVGRPVVDLLRRGRPGGTIVPVSVTNGDEQSYSNGYYRVPKRDVIIGLQVLFQTGGVRLAQGLPEAETLTKELMAMEVKVTPGGAETLEAWRKGAHDDLVFAVGLGCWGAQELAPAPRPGDEAWWTNPREAEMAEVFRKVMREREGGW